MLVSNLVKNKNQYRLDEHEPWGTRKSHHAGVKTHIKVEIIRCFNCSFWLGTDKREHSPTGKALVSHLLCGAGDNSVAGFNDCDSLCQFHGYSWI